MKITPQEADELMELLMQNQPLGVAKTAQFISLIYSAKERVIGEDGQSSYSWAGNVTFNIEVPPPPVPKEIPHDPSQRAPNLDDDVPF
jgi:hypothetical protein